MAHATSLVVGRAGTPKSVFGYRQGGKTIRFLTLYSKSVFQKQSDNFDMLALSMNISHFNLDLRTLWKKYYMMGIKTL